MISRIIKNKNAQEPITIAAIDPPPILPEFDVSINKLLFIASVILNIPPIIY